MANMIGEHGTWLDGDREVQEEDGRSKTAGTRKHTFDNYFI